MIVSLVCVSWLLCWRQPSSLGACRSHASPCHSKLPACTTFGDQIPQTSQQSVCRACLAVKNTRQQYLLWRTSWSKSLPLATHGRDPGWPRAMQMQRLHNKSHIRDKEGYMVATQDAESSLKQAQCATKLFMPQEDFEQDNTCQVWIAIKSGCHSSTCGYRQCAEDRVMSSIEGMSAFPARKCLLCTIFSWGLQPYAVRAGQGLSSPKYSSLST